MRPRSVVVLAAVVIVQVVVWTIALVTTARPYLPQQALAEFLSTTAIVTASTNLMLATRAKPLDAAFGGLDKLFTTHRIDGVAVALIISGHILIVPKSSVFVWAMPVGITAATLILTSVVLAIAPRSPWRGLVTLRYQDWKAEHRFMGIFIAIAATHSLLAGTLTRFLPPVRFWVYGMIVLGLTAYAYRETVFRFVARRHRYEVTGVRQVGSRITEVSLDGVRSPIRYRPGQFAFVSFAGGPTRERHPFTISRAAEGDKLRFSIEAAGDYTGDLQTHMAKGTSASVEGPYGGFDFRRGKARQLWLAGGAGITPFLAFLGRPDPAFDVTLVWSVHDESQAGYRQEIAVAAVGWKGMRVIAWPTSERGHLRLGDLGIERPEELSVFLCGPVPMREAFVAQLRELGVPVRDMHYEAFTLR